MLSASLTLLINLVSHIVAEKFHRKSLEEYSEQKDDGINEEDRNSLWERNKSRWKIRTITMNILNYASVFTLILGVFFFIIFAYSNIDNMAKKNSGSDNSGPIKKTEVYEKMGRVSPPPPPPQPKVDTTKKKE